MTSNKNTYRILIIDDNPAIHEDFKKILAKPLSNQKDLEDMEAELFGSEMKDTVKTDFQIDCALQGKEGLEMAIQAQAEGSPYALVFVDGRMPPGWDGIETISHIWQECPDIQAVLCTAYADYSWQEIRNVLGESDSLLILKKPFDNVEVLQMAHALTRKWELSREIQGRLNKLAFYDSLTGLPNRTLFIDRLSNTIEKARRYGHMCATLFIDMDNFKRINDTLGHGVGDELLRETANRLSKCLRASDTIARQVITGLAARLGGDEFTIVLPVLEDKKDAETVVRRISETLTQPMELSEHQVTITPSIGIALFPQDGENEEELMKKADLAMYYAKRIGPNSFKFYDKSMDESGLKRLTIENHLRNAIDLGELSLNYQPQIDFETGKMSGMEALLRWNNWELGNIPPLEFISIAEESGLIIPIGEWVLKTACTQAVAWLREGLPVERMAVNLSVRQLAQPGFVKTVADILDKTGLAPENLELEITESLLENDSSAFITILEEFKSMNIRIAVDDFGNGYSNMNRLKDMPLNCIKIDRSFVGDIENGSINKSIVSAILSMAKAMDVRVVAEGVETEGQADFLKGKHCQEGQGYLFSRPLNSERTESYLRNIKKLSDNRDQIEKD